MPLFWISGSTGKARAFMVVEAASVISARLKASIAGFADPLKAEVLPLDGKRARKVPKAMQGRLLSQKEAAELVRKLG